jgi:hypothetical protein
VILDTRPEFGESKKPGHLCVDGTISFAALTLIGIAWKA